jgi:hypothetical protein
MPLEEEGEVVADEAAEDEALFADADAAVALALALQV